MGCGSHKLGPYLTQRPLGSGAVITMKTTNKTKGWVGTLKAREGVGYTMAGWVRAGNVLMVPLPGLLVFLAHSFPTLCLANPSFLVGLDPEKGL